MLSSNLTTKDIERFWKKVIISDNPDDCWEWNACLWRGYSTFWLHGKSEYGHRVSYLIAYGDIPDGLFVCHHCDNPRCVNPLHLFLGTHKDNMDDMLRKGRKAVLKGNDNPHAKVTMEDVIEIRKRYVRLSKDNNLVTLAREFNITPQQVYYIVKHLQWKE